MQCRQCQSANEPGRKFCRNCGAELLLVCSACSFFNKIDDNFCGGCGEKLSLALLATDHQPNLDNALEQDLRRVTIWFCDIAGFTNLANFADAEAIHSMLNQFFEGVDGIVHSFGGTIDKHIGDNVMALFGAPVAHENDPERAVYAALSVHDWVADLSKRLSTDIRVHIGIATGRVVAGGSGSAYHRSYTVVGESVNLASRLEDLATAGETLISDEIRREIGSRINAEDLGFQSMKNYNEPVKVWKVLPETKYNPLSDTIEGIFVGREEEIKSFKEVLDRQGPVANGSVFYIRGDAGMGKSRLLQTFLMMGKDRGYRCHEVRNLSFGMGNDRSVLRVFISGLLGFGLNESDDVQREVINNFIDREALDKKDTTILFDVFDIPQPLDNKIILDAMTSNMRFHAKVDFVSKFIVSLSTDVPQIVSIEDLHFADEMSLAIVKQLFKETKTSKIILICSSRIENETLGKKFWHQNIDQYPVQIIDLQPLSFEESYQVARYELDMSDDILRKCVERSEGNPLFLDQLLRNADTVLEEGTVPGTIETMMIARTDRLPDMERQALKTASVYGQWFTLDMVHHLIGSSETLFNAALASYLIKPENSGFIFTHSMLQEAIYNSHLSIHKKKLHDKAATWYSGRDTMLEAQHLDRAENPKADSAYLLAAQDCQQRFQFTRGLPLVERGIELSDTPAIEFQLTCLQAYMTREIGKTGSAIDMYQNAVELIDKEELQCEAWIGIAACNRWMGKGEESALILAKTEEVAKRCALPKRLTQVGYYRGSYLFTQNNLSSAEVSYRIGLENAERCEDNLWVARNLSGLADCYYAGMRMSKALSAFRECLEIAHQEGLGRIEVANRYMTGLTRRYLNEMQQALEDAIAAKQLAIEVGHHRSEMYSTNFIAEFLLDMGKVDEAIEASSRAVEITFLTGNERFRAYAMNQLARGYLMSGKPNRALEVLDEAINISRKVGMSFVGPRLLGTLSICPTDDEQRKAAVKEGVGILRSGCHAHNQLWFLRDAIESALISDERKSVIQYTDWLERITLREPLPWSNYFIERGRVLVRHRHNPKNSKYTKEIDRLTKMAEGVGFSSHSMS